MLRKFAYNKIFRTTGMLFLFLLLLLFPAGKEYSLEDEKVIMTYKNVKKEEVFLIDKDNYVARTKIDLNYNSLEDKALKLVEILIIDGKLENEIPNGFKAIMPSDTKVNSIKIDNDKIYIDISKDFFELKKGDDIKAIEAITYNLTTIDNIKYVYIKIDGKDLSYLSSSNYYIQNPLTRNIGINKQTKLNGYKGASETTIYYVNKNNNNSYYYVPVTKINNDDRDKIKIIVDELTSTSVYETNLMSFLNYNTKLLNYELKDDILTLNFNNFLFDDESTNSILEEVIYSISLSVRDNYDVKEVVFDVDGKQITKSVLKNIE